MMKLKLGLGAFYAPSQETNYEYVM